MALANPNVKVVLVEEIPLLVNGKIDRQQMLRDYAKTFKSLHYLLKTKIFHEVIKIMMNLFKQGKPSLCKWNENELNRLDEEMRNMASTLFKTILSVLGGSLHKPLCLSDNYFYVGGNSLNAVIVVTKLRDQGFNLGKLFC